MAATEADEFRSDVRLHFIERNYEVLRKFEGRCALATYVNVVVQRVFLDWRNRMWGRWRPSTDARRLGPTAILIERLVTRDGWTLDQALETVKRQSSDRARRDAAEVLQHVAARTPGRRMVSEDDAAEVASPGPTADDNLVMAERDFLAKRVQTALDRARQALPPMDRLILKMRFEDRAAVSDIARALHLEQRPLYRTLERLLKTVGDDHAGRRHFARGHRRAVRCAADRVGEAAIRTAARCRRRDATGRQERKGALVASEPMKVNGGTCPSLETIGAFVDGRFEDREREAIADHLASCETCYFVFSEAARTQVVAQPKAERRPVHAAPR